MEKTTTPRQREHHEDLASWELTLAQCVVSHFLSTRRRFRALDAEDLVQECLMHWVVRRPRYSVSRGASESTFMRGVLEKKLVDIERRERAGKRGGHSRDVSLDEEQGVVSDEGDGVTLLEVLPSCDPWDNPEEVIENYELKAQIEKVLGLLTLRQTELAEGLRQGMSVAEASKKMAVPRATLYDEIERIRRVFRDEGLEEYLG